MFPLVGQWTRAEYLIIDEIEAACWLIEYSMMAYLDNYDMHLKLSDIGKCDNLRIKSIDPETGRIELSRFSF
jgi:hypothetical protein